MVMDRNVKLVAAVIASAVLSAGVAWTSFHSHGYGYLLFIGAPVLLGFVATSFLAVGSPENFTTCAAVVSIAGVVLCCGFLVTGAEGLICIAMALPIALPLALVGAVPAFFLFHERRLRRPRATAIGAGLLLIALVPLEADHRSPMYVAEDSIIVNATAARTWRAIVALSDVAPSHDLLFRAGIACPQRTKIVDGRPGGLRVCTLSTGVLMERIDVWEPERRLAWRAISTPPPMRELNPFRDADPPHLHGYYRNVRGEFVITRLAPDRCRLTRRTWYSADLYPSWYWRIWCDMGAAKIQQYVLEQVREAAT
jgi:hypothetical protein